MISGSRILRKDLESRFEEEKTVNVLLDYNFIKIRSFVMHKIIMTYFTVDFGVFL